MTAGCGDLEVLSDLAGHSFGRVGKSIGRKGKHLTQRALKEDGRGRTAESQQR